MKPAPVPTDETARLERIQELGLLDTPPEERFDRITRIATRLFSVPISTVSLIDKDREFYKSCQGLNEREGDRAVSFCGHAMWEDDVFVISDALADERFADNPLVIEPPYIRFYAGKSILTADGLRMGTLCIKDVKPREFSDEDRRVLTDLSRWVELEINNLNAIKSLGEGRH